MYKKLPNKFNLEKNCNKSEISVSKWMLCGHIPLYFSTL